MHSNPLNHLLMSKWVFTNAHKSPSDTNKHIPSWHKTKMGPQTPAGQQTPKHTEESSRINTPPRWVLLMPRPCIYELCTCCSVQRLMELFIWKWTSGILGELQAMNCHSLAQVLCLDCPVIGSKMSGTYSSSSLKCIFFFYVFQLCNSSCIWKKKGTEVEATGRI